MLKCDGKKDSTVLQNIQKGNSSDDNLIGEISPFIQSGGGEAPSPILNLA